jgi:hypothetical protein
MSEEASTYHNSKQKILTQSLSLFSNSTFSNTHICSTKEEKIKREENYTYDR